MNENDCYSTCCVIHRITYDTDISVYITLVKSEKPGPYCPISCIFLVLDNYQHTVKNNHCVYSE